MKTWQHEGGKWTKGTAQNKDLAPLLSGKHEVGMKPEEGKIKMIYKGNAVFGATCVGVDEDGSDVAQARVEIPKVLVNGREVKKHDGKIRYKPCEGTMLPLDHGHLHPELDLIPDKRLPLETEVEK